MKNFLLVVAATLAAAAAHPTLAAVVYANPPILTAGQGGDCVYNTTCGSEDSGNTFGAQEFVLSASTTIGSIGWNSVITFGGPGSSVNWQILDANGSGGLPGTLVASGSGTVSFTAGPTGSAFSTTDYSVPVGSVGLDAGAYYVALQLVTDNFYDYLAIGVAGSGSAESDDGGASWVSGYHGLPSVSVALCSDSGPCDVPAPAVPEPASFVLFGTALFGLGVVRRRRMMTKPEAPNPTRVIVPGSGAAMGDAKNP